MSTPLRELYEPTREKFRLKLLAGKAGLGNAVNWIYIAEDMQNIPFLEGGEFAITTGLFTQSGVTLTDYIQSLAVHNSSGLIINVGKYIQPVDITPDITAFCDRYGFPLMTMPWDVHLVDVMQDFSLLLIQNIQSTETLNTALQNALYQEPVQDNILRIAERYGFPRQAKYRLVLIQNLQSPANVERELNASGLKYHIFAHEALWILLYRVPEKEPARKVADMLCYCDSIRLGFSDTFTTLSDLGGSYRQARFAMAAAVYWRRRVVSFSELGLLQILFYTTDTQRLTAMQKRQLGALEQYDLAHHAELMETLHTYLICGGVLETAQQLHTHRNTILYRLKRIREILQVDLDNAAVRYELLTAFFIREYFQIQQ